MPGRETILANAIYITWYIFFPPESSLRSLTSLQEHLQSQVSYANLLFCSFNTKNSDVREHAYLQADLVYESQSMHSSYMCSLFCLTYHRDLVFYRAYQILEWKEMPWNPSNCEVIRNTLLPKRKKGWRRKDEAEGKTIKLPF